MDHGFEIDIKRTHNHDGSNKDKTIKSCSAGGGLVDINQKNSLSLTYFVSFCDGQL
jgi:hypothetical protein